MVIQFYGIKPTKQIYEYNIRRLAIKIAVYCCECKLIQDGSERYSSLSSYNSRAHMDIREIYTKKLKVSLCISDLISLQRTMH